MSCSSAPNSSHRFEVDPSPTWKGSLEAKSFQTCGLSSHLQEVFLESFQFSGMLFQRIWSWMPPQMMGSALHCQPQYLALVLASVKHWPGKEGLGVSLEDG